MSSISNIRVEKAWDRFAANEIKLACEKLGLPGFAPYITWRFIRIRKIKTGALAAYANGLGKITFDRASWNQCTWMARGRLVEHEVCHIVAMLHNPQSEDHGGLWQGLMKRVGSPLDYSFPVK